MRRWLLGVILAGTVAASAALIMGRLRGEDATEAKIAVVTRGDVRCVTAISGRVSDSRQTLVYASAPGLISEVLVTEGERVAQGQALMRLDASAAERVVSAWIASGESLNADMQAVLDATVIRAPENGTVRTLLTMGSAAVAAGAPVAVLADGEECIRCIVQEADAKQLRAGQRARLAIDGQAVGTAVISRIGGIAAEEMTGRMIREVVLTPEGALPLPVGTAVDVDVILEERFGVPLLPVEAVTDRDTVWWVCDGRCTEIPVQILLNDEIHVWVELPEGTQVAIGEFAEGQRVREVQP